MTALKWLGEGTRLTLTTVERLSDADFDAPSLLPGWARRHVVAHLINNAEALRRLVYWARTGEVTPMYPSAEQRDAEIEQAAKLPVAELRAKLRDSAEALTRDLEALPEEAWQREVRSWRDDRPILATEIPWLRTREVVVHAIDLDAGTDFDDVSPELLKALVDDLIAARVAGGHGPALARWLTGRSEQAPDLGPWL